MTMSYVRPLEPDPKEGVAPEMRRGTEPVAVETAALPFGAALYRHGIKRAIDVAAVVMAAPVVLPLVAGLAFAVARDGGKPFYSQTRIGKDGRPFRMWKLRSMVLDADMRLKDHLRADPAARAEWNETQKLRRDPRITPFGRFLRQTSLDELPQLWNVFRGDMSLVGPRPMMVEQRTIYHGVGYFALRPGLTGLWQTAGRNRTSFAERAAYDDEYEATLSLRTDLKIIIRTLGVVWRGTGY